MTAKVINLHTFRQAKTPTRLIDATEADRAKMLAVGADDRMVDMLINIARQMRAQRDGTS